MKITLFLLASLAGGCSDSRWSLDRARVSIHRSIPKEAVLHEGTGGPGGVGIGMSPLQTLRRIAFADAKILATSSGANDSFRIHKAYGWKDTFVLVDLGGPHHPCSVIKGGDPLGITPTVEVAHVMPSGYDASGKQTARRQNLGWLGASLVISEDTGSEFEICRVDAASLQITRTRVAESSNEALLVGNTIVLRNKQSLLCVTPDGSEVWRCGLENAERLPRHPLEDSSSERFVTLRGGKPGFVYDGPAGHLVVRDAKSGVVQWEVKLDSAVNVKLAGALGDHVVIAFDTHNEFVYTNGVPHERWIVFDYTGRQVATGQVREGDAPAADEMLTYELGLAWNFHTRELVIGASINAVYIRGTDRVLLTSLPGQAMAVSDGLIVCDTGKKLEAKSMSECR